MQNESSRMGSISPDADKDSQAQQVLMKTVAAYCYMLQYCLALRCSKMGILSVSSTLPGVALVVP